MAVSSLRRTRPIEDETEDLFADFSENDIRLTSIEIRTATALCDNYQYDGQRILQGNFEYDEPSQYGADRTVSIDFEYRSGSNIFILKTEVDFQISRFIQELNSISPNNFQIYRSLTPTRQHLWDFFRNSDGLVEMTVLTKKGQEVDMESLDEPMEEIAEKYPIESATAIFEFGDQSIVTRYTEGTINIDTDDPKANEYITQLFERDVIGGGDG